MEKLIVLALLIVNVHLVAGNCSYETQVACNGGYTACQTAGNSTTDSTCACYGQLLLCLLDNNCISNNDYEGFVHDCTNFPCPLQDCLGGSGAPIDNSPISLTPAASPSCNQPLADVCLTDYYRCAENRSDNAVCTCYGPYLSCYFNSGCLNESDYQKSIVTCEEFGCTLQQCTLPTDSPSSETPVTAPIVEPPSYSPVDAPSTCSLENSNACYNSYLSCVNAPENNSTHNCPCYGTYIYCLYYVGCFSYDQYQENVNRCVQAGCTYQQCTTTIQTPVQEPISSSPVSEPTSSTPSSSSVPVSAPVSEPFAPPTAVICLQPWELVLIVVGSVLAGIGLAAIVGVIIYLSRRSSVNKTATKYAKLQNY